MIGSDAAPRSEVQCKRDSREPEAVVRSLRVLLGPPWRTLIPGLAVLGAFLLVRFPFWSPGVDVLDGRHDRGRNAIWLQHGWLGHDEWFRAHAKEDRLPHFRDPASARALADLLRRHRIADVFPHLCPASIEGTIAAVDHAQVERFLDAFGDVRVRVLPWIGGARGKQAFPEREAWRSEFARSAAALLTAHPRLAGMHVNLEPCPSGSEDFLRVLEELRRAIPSGKQISVAAYPPPTILHPYLSVHWEEEYFRAVAQRCDQLVPMMYDTALAEPNAYERLMRDWTVEMLAWSEPTPLVLGLPAYTDAGVRYHRPEVENLHHALRGVHAGLLRAKPLPPHYQGVALYCEWEMDDEEWRLFRERFLAR